MNTKVELPILADKIVYVKPVEVSDLPPEVREQAGDLKELFSVHNSQGDQIALVADRALAFALARQHELTPMTVH